MDVIYQLLFACRIAILSIWSAGVTIVTKGMFVVPAMIRHISPRPKSENERRAR